MSYFHTKTHLQPNFFEVELHEENISVYTSKYSEHEFTELINRGDGYFYYRSGNNLYAIPEKNDLNEPLGFYKKNVHINDDPYLFSKIIEVIFRMFFTSKKREVFKKKYTSLLFFKIKSEDSFSLGQLTLNPVCYFSSHSLIRKEKIIFIFSLSKEYKPQLNQSLSNYEKMGVDTRDWEFREERLLSTYSNIKKYLDRTNQQEKYKNAVSRLRNKRNELEFIEKTCTYLNKNINNINNSLVSLKSISLLGIPNTNFEVLSIKKPTQYYYNKTTTQGYIHTAIEQLKPLSFDLFQNQEVSICIFIPKLDAKQCESYNSNIKNMLSNIFHLYNVTITEFYTGSDRNEHLSIISKFTNRQFDLAIIYLYEKDKAQKTYNSAYTKLKAKLISKQIPSQSILVENARINNIYSLRNLSLNIYSKLGGTPWAIEKDGLDTNEFIIGVGSSIDEEGQRNIGFASVFDHFGSYMVGSCSSLCGIENYRENLKNYLASTLSEIIDSRGISKDSKIRLVFHLYKSASKKYELSAINQCLEEFAEYQIEYAIINITFNHPFKLYKNVTDQLDRGCFIKLTDYHAFLCMGGSGTQPLQIRLDNRSTYKDLFELSKQVLYFSHLSHRSFKPSNNPVTVIYPQRLVKLTTDLLKVNYWDTDMLHGMKDKLWFI